MKGLRVSSLSPVCALLAPALASAKPKSLDPVSVHDRIVKRDVGSWICIGEANGIALIGRIVAIGDDSVELQLGNNPEVSTAFYREIVDLAHG